MSWAGLNYVDSIDRNAEYTSTEEIAGATVFSPLECFIAIARSS